MPPLLAFYGDDFTGSCDCMEVLQWSGLKTVLFLDAPAPEQLAKFDSLRAIGIAGWSRTMSPTEMEIELKPALESLRDSGASIVHYKTCSTFDSSPSIGSIGKALELGRSVLGTGVVPIVVAAPQLGRYQAFGNLFARSGLDTQPYRLDRHPTMSRHPITPMCESDIRTHLRQQTDLSVELVDCLQLDEDQSQVVWTRLDSAAVLFDALVPEHLTQIGAVIQALVDSTAPRFVLGSSGIEYALTAHWQNSGEMAKLQSHAPSRPRFGAAEQLVVITGSCSPVNDRQIAWAEQHGFETLPIHAAKLLNAQTCAQETERIVEQCLKLLRSGANVILHSARGPHDPRVAETVAAFAALGFGELDIKLRSGRTLGPKLGAMLRAILDQHPCRRVGVAGGDTSGYVARALGLVALEAIAPLAPGSPLCRGHAENAMDGVEFFFKGGQVGKDDVWSTMLSGTTSNNSIGKMS